MAYYALHFRHARHQRCVQAFDRTNFYSRSDKIITSDKQLKAVWHTVWRTIKNKKKKNPDVWHQNSKVFDMHLRVTSPPLVSNKSNLWQSRKCLQYLLFYCLFVCYEGLHSIKSDGIQHSAVLQRRFHHNCCTTFTITTNNVTKSNAFALL